MNEPCINCLCLPVCKRQHMLYLIRKCPLFEDYIKMVECNVPRNSYRYLQFHALDLTYEVSKKDTDNAWWTIRTYDNGKEGYGSDIDEDPIYINQ